jgi:hypothetical protein
MYRGTTRVKKYAAPGCSAADNRDKSSDSHSEEHSFFNYFFHIISV